MNHSWSCCTVNNTPARSHLSDNPLSCRSLNAASLSQKSTVSCPRGRCQGVVVMTVSPPAQKWFPLPCSPHRIRASRAPAVRITELPQHHHGIRGKSATFLGWAQQGWPWPLYSLHMMCLIYVMDLLSYAQNKWVIIFKFGEQEMLKLNGSRIFSELRGHAACFRLIRNEQLAGTFRRGCSFYFIPADSLLTNNGLKNKKKCLECFMYLLNGFRSQWGFTCESDIYLPLVCQRRSSLTSFTWEIQTVVVIAVCLLNSYTNGISCIYWRQIWSCYSVVFFCLLFCHAFIHH